ncbi:MAG TPA: TetR/AcrR family transcriptional regulator [Bacillus bacterium]|nr:TetR/AcrR family transcriptional regulator [Bacillus sp. (in: firmicutes)]
MKEKEIAIIEAAIKLYATKGFASTSIQEIVTESGMSKGAFYLYFKSKDALLFAILEYYFDRIQKNVNAYDNENLSPREKFSKQLSALLNTLLEHKEFVIMQSREQAIPLNEQVKTLLLRKLFEAHRFYQESLLSIYGNKIENHLWDLSLMMDGMFNSYVKLLLFDKEHFQVNELVAFLLKRMDSIVKGLDGEKPLAITEKVEDLFKRTESFFLKNDHDIIDLIENMKKIVSDLENSEDLKVSIEVLEGEINTEHPRLAVIKGMLSNFKGIGPLDFYRKEIAKQYNLNI